MKKSIFLVLIGILGIGSIMQAQDWRRPEETIGKGFPPPARRKAIAQPEVVERMPRYQFMQRMMQGAGTFAAQQFDALKEQYQKGRISLNQFLQKQDQILQEQNVKKVGEKFERGRLGYTQQALTGRSPETIGKDFPPPATIKERAKPQIAGTTPPGYTKVQESFSKGIASARQYAAQKFENAAQKFERLKEKYRAGKITPTQFLQEQDAIKQQSKIAQELPSRPAAAAIIEPSIVSEERKPTFTAEEKVELVQPVVRPTHPPREDLTKEEFALKEAFMPEWRGQYRYSEFVPSSYYKELAKKRIEAYQQAYEQGGLRKRSYSVPTYSVPVSEVGKRYPIDKRYPGRPRYRQSYFRKKYQPGYRPSTEME